jgi:hypothetical protein
VQELQVSLLVDYDDDPSDGDQRIARAAPTAARSEIHPSPCVKLVLCREAKGQR